MIPIEIFHYTSASIALEKILFNQTLKIEQIKFTNDPRESKDWYLLPRNLVNTFNQSLINMEFTEIKQEEWKVVCFSVNAPKYKLHPNSNIVEGFLYGACRPRMWANYADNHKGVCLKFNGKNFDQKIRVKKDDTEKGRKVYRGKVKYIDHGDTMVSASVDYTELSRISVTQGLRNHLIKYRREFFFTKSTDWKTEFEYRWLVHSENRNFELILIKEAIEEVIIGHNFSEVYLPSLYVLCDNLKIPVRKIEWRNGYPIIYKLNR